jgi:tRNA threonylcarbamoyl adenosine modification protein YeaZ
MKILALELSSPQRSVAAIDGPVGGTPLVCHQQLDTANPPAGLLSMIENVLAEARLEREQIECLAIGLGPGSYTGIRAAIAAAQGWQLARPVNVMGISSADCLASQAQMEGFCGKCTVLIDAQREEFYVASYTVNTSGWEPVEPLHLAPRAELLSRLKKEDRIIGPEVAAFFPGARLMFPQAATLGAMALRRPGNTPGDQLQPLYLRETKFVKAPPPRIMPV